MDYQTRLQFLTDQLNAVILSMRQALVRGDTADLDALRGLLRGLANDIQTLNSDAIQQGAPSTFMTVLSDFSDTAINAAKTVGVDLQDALGGIAQGAGATAKALPTVLIGLLVVAAIVGIGYIRHGGVTVRRA